jgi:hypothetical protein
MSASGPLETYRLTWRMSVYRSTPEVAGRKIAERYAAGETMADLAREYEVGEATIWRALQGPFDMAA